MPPTNKHPDAAEADLRRRAEARLQEQIAEIPLLSHKEIQTLVHELDVHRIELLMQNDELRSRREELEESRDRYADLYDFAPVGYVTLNSAGIVLEANLTAAQMLEVVRAQLLDRPLVGYVAASDKNRFLEHLRRCKPGDQVVTTELGMVGARGQKLVVQLQSTKVDAGELRAHCRTAIIDTTERKMAEDELRRLTVELEDRVAERTTLAERRAQLLRTLAAELTRAEERERRRLAQVLHDHLQQLLVASRMKVGLVRRRTADEGLRQTLEQIETMINESINESRNLTAELSPPVLYDHGLVAALQWLGRQMQERHGLGLEIVTDEALEPADEATRVFLFQAARELLLNVVKHAHAAAAVVEISTPEPGRLHLAVLDRGVGFDPQRAEPHKGLTGFGLFSIRERLELIGGRLNVESSPGQGTRVVIDVPRQPSAPRPPAPPIGVPSSESLPVPPVSPSAGSDARPRVMLADDHNVLRKGLASLLREQGRIDVVGEAANGVEAVEQALRYRPDVVLMDITMPLLSGIEATRRIVAALPGTRVIGLSMHEEADMAQAMLSAGAVAYLRKDVPSEALVAAVLGELEEVKA